MKIILTGHGETSIAMKGAIEMIFGKADNFYPVPFVMGEGLESLTRKIEDTISNFDETEEILVISDLFSGTPYNAAATLCLKKKVTDVIAGMSLPICLEVANFANTKKVSELVPFILGNSPSYTRALSQELNIQEEDDL